MTDITALDLAHQALELDPENDAAHLRFYHLLADSELFLLLDGDPDGAEEVSPQLFPLEVGDAVLAFDREDRLADFAEGPAPYAALPGRVIVQMLAGQGVSLGLNLGVAPSSFLMPAEAIDWLADTLSLVPETGDATPEGFAAPDLPDGLMEDLADKLSRLAGQAEAVVLAKVVYDDGGEGHLMAFLGAAADREAGLAKAVGEALAFSGLPASVIDVAFFAPDEPLAQAMAQVGLRLDMPLPEPEEEVEVVRLGPGMDPTKPPILR